MVRRLTRFIGTTIVTVLLASLALSAQVQSPDGFVPVTPADRASQEQLPATPLVFAAYAFVWVALLVYVFTLWRRVARVERELADVNARLRESRR